MKKNNVAQEVVLFMKTGEACVCDLTKRVAELHSYDEPCIVSWNIDTGAPDFLNWVHAQTEKQEPNR